MKGVIVYSTKTGTTKKCAEYIKEQTNFEIFNLRDKTYKKQFVFDDYDFIVLGAPYRMSMLDKPMKKFLKKYGNYLLDKKFAIFGVGISKQSYGQMFKYYDNLIEESVCTVWLSGELVTQGIKGISVSISSALIAQYEKNNQPLPQINQIDLERFCKKIIAPESDIEFKTNLIINSEDDEDIDEEETFEDEEND
jgi:menaquinone-dependent protoporphyrinogen oxidase